MLIESETPEISVILPVYNADKYLHAALNSLKKQTFRDFEVLMINDGSTDSSLQILQEMEKSDSRFRVVHLPQNRGIVGALNVGIELARGNYIARMDADDISLPDRFEKQMQYIRNHQDVFILGTGLSYIDENGERLGIDRFSDFEIPVLTQTPILHATVIIRRHPVFTSGLRYRKEFNYAEDYCLWLEALKMWKADALNEVLYLYRNYDEATRFSKLKSVLWATIRVKLFAIRQLGYTPRVSDVIRFSLELILMIIPTVVIKKIYLRRLFRKRNENSLSNSPTS